jgi:2-C-methyl-D-erythritol 4-phosphate cytidylyltransferase
MATPEPGVANASGTRAPRRFAVVAAAGSGSRFGSVRKQYARIGGVTLLAHAVAALRTALALDAVFVAIAADDRGYADAGVDATAIALRCGGESRARSIANALDAIADRTSGDDWILVHDAARPCVDHDSLQRLVREVGDDAVGGLLALPLADTLKRAAGGERDGGHFRVGRTEARDGLWCAQTPQMFRYAVLRRALDAARMAAYTDEAQAVEALGLSPRLVRGSPANIKVTYASDLELAAAVLALRVPR